MICNTKKEPSKLIYLLKFVENENSPGLKQFLHEILQLNFA